jgi:hypothetical protein
MTTTKASLHHRAEGLGAAAHICKKIAQTTDATKAAGAMECLIAIQTEITRTLALAGRME